MNAMRTRFVQDIHITLLLLLAVCIFVVAGCGTAVGGSNRNPEINGLEAEKEGCITPLTSFKIRCNASDADGDSLAYECSASGGTFLGEGAMAIWQAPNPPGEYRISVTVKDGRGGEADTELVIRVRTNTPPVIDQLITDTRDVGMGKTAAITCIANDPDGNEISYHWSATRGNISGDGAEVNWVAPMTCAAYEIKVRVVDSCGAESSEKLRLDVVDLQSGRPHR